MIEPIRRDLRRGLRNPDTGRRGLTPQQVLRSLVLMRDKNWDYRELRERIADGCRLRQFTDFYCRPVPKHDAFDRAFIRSRHRRYTRSMRYWSLPPSLPVWKMAAVCGSIPQWFKPMFITRLTILCFGIGARPNTSD